MLEQVFDSEHVEARGSGNDPVRPPTVVQLENLDRVAIAAARLDEIVDTIEDT